jgi:20S proteasome alpha/beta subunit
LHLVRFFSFFAFTNSLLIIYSATQHLPGSNSYGLLAVQGIFFSSSSLRNANDKVLWRVDPSGQFFRCTAAVVGWGSQSIEQHFLTELLASTAKGAEDTAVSNEPTAKKLSAASVREILSKWTVEQALGVAADCIRAAQAKKQRPQGISSSDSTRPMLQLQGMSLVDNKVTWYNATQLEALGEAADWS